MVPTTPLVKGNRPQIAHESINDLPVHRLTDPQIFHPVSESRQFTRIDAGRVFSAAPALEHTESSTEDLIDPVKAANRIKRDPRSIERVGKGDEETQVLQPADVRIPHPQLVMYERDRITYPNEQRLREKRYEKLLKSQEEADQEAKRLAKEREEKRTTRIQPESSRFEFRITDVTVSEQTTGADGRGPRGVGRRYGVPNYDRKKGQVKIPTKVEVWFGFRFHPFLFFFFCKAGCTCRYIPEDVGSFSYEYCIITMLTSNQCTNTIGILVETPKASFTIIYRIVIGMLSYHEFCSVLQHTIF